MRIAILSGKGGTGKTFVSVNLAYTAENATYIDCDVEEPNGRLFLKPTEPKTIPVHRKLPTFDDTTCIGCRACVDFCHFNALIFLRNKPKLFPEVCHSCGGCQIVCKQHAITENARQVGVIEIGNSNDIRVVTGILNIGEASAVPVIQSALYHGLEQEKPNLNCTSIGDAIQPTVVIDCPPGSSCSVMESVAESDYCLLVVEPTAFGFHNFQMVHELVTLMNKPCGIVINKAYEAYAPLYDYCYAQQIPILLEIPYESQLAELSAKGEIVTQYHEQLANDFQTLLTRLRKEVCS